jgi:hypothetical protein
MAAVLGSMIAADPDLKDPPAFLVGGHVHSVGDQDACA